MPFAPERLKDLRHLKGFNQKALAARTERLTQSQISECEQRGTQSTDLVEQLAEALDCTTDFLLGRGPALDLRQTASRMAFDVFAANLPRDDPNRQRCSKVLGHPSAPITSADWAVLAEHIKLAIGPSDGVVPFRKVDADVQ